MNQYKVYKCYKGYKGDGDMGVGHMGDGHMGDGHMDEINNYLFAARETKTCVDKAAVFCVLISHVGNTDSIS